MASRFGFITNVKSGMVLDVRGRSIKPGAEVLIWNRKSHGYENQLWTFDDDGFLVNKKSGLVLEAPLTDGYLRSETPLIQQERMYGSMNQRWDFDEQHRLVSLQDRSMCIWGMHGNVEELGTNAVIVGELDRAASQEWRFESP